MFDDCRCKTTSLANLPVGGVEFELKRKEFEREPIKIVFVGADVRRLGVCPTNGSWRKTPHVVSYIGKGKNGLAQMRGEI